MSSTILSRGYKKPTTNDTGSTFFPDIEADIQLVNDHTHNGADGAPLGKTQSVSSGSWAADGTSGRYKQTVTLPTYTNGTVSYQLKFDEIGILIKNTSGEVCYPKISKNGTNAYDIFTNDSTVSFTALYI